MKQILITDLRAPAPLIRKINRRRQRRRLTMAQTCALAAVGMIALAWLIEVLR